MTIGLLQNKHAAAGVELTVTSNTFIFNIHVIANLLLLLKTTQLCCQILILLPLSHTNI